MNKFWKITLGTVTILSLIYAVYSNLENKKERIPVFIVEPIRTELLDANSTQLAPIKIYSNNGREITQDLTSVTFYFWNRGKEPIFKNDILKPVLINIDSSASIIDFKILKESRDVCGINLNKIDSNILELDFSILEQNDGITAQIIFEGKKDSKLNISTTIVGVKEISNKDRSPLSKFGNIILKILLGIVSLFAGLILNYILNPPKQNEMEEIYESKLMLVNEEYKSDVKELEKLTEKEIQIKTTLREAREASKETQSLKKWLLKLLLKIIGITIVITILGFSLSYIFEKTSWDTESKNKTEIPTSISPIEY